MNSRLLTISGRLLAAITVVIWTFKSHTSVNNFPYLVGGMIFVIAAVVMLRGFSFHVGVSSIDWLSVKLAFLIDTGVSLINSNLLSVVALFALASFAFGMYLLRK